VSIGGGMWVRGGVVGVDAFVYWRESIGEDTGEERRRKEGRRKEGWGGGGLVECVEGERDEGVKNAIIGEEQRKRDGELDGGAAIRRK